MKLLVVGGGGREHAIVKYLKKNPKVEKIFCLPGNGGIAADAECVDIGAKDIPAIVDFAVKNRVDFAVVAPDDPLVLGAVDELTKANIPCFGPNRRAAMIEGSKVFAKQLMKQYGIPTADFQVFDDAEKAVEYLKTCEYPTVIKADGLALGKGVIIPESFEEAKAAIQTIMVDKAFGKSGERVVIEQCLTGPEVTVLAFTDGKTVVPMVSSMDHKRIGDGDQGPNTGGMGTVAPNPHYTEAVAKECMARIFLPTIDAMNREGRPFKGCLYFGLMLTRDGPMVIEYNCRFGDPETQVVLPLLETDLLSAMLATANGTLAQTPVRFRRGASCCVVMASKGYPKAYEKGKKIDFNGANELPDVEIFHAGTALKGGELITSGGRVLGVTAIGENLATAIDKAYAATEKICFDGAYYRRDIGEKALKANQTV
ncbi:MAG: phosphoribosylamine--glycine ligase [Christensenellales bacterium]|jgi:phosphoribosylamine--glycine ligase